MMVMTVMVMMTMVTSKPALSPLTRPGGRSLPHHPHQDVHNPTRDHQHTHEIRREKHDSGDQQQPEPTEPLDPPILFLPSLRPPGRLDASRITILPRDRASPASTLTLLPLPPPAVIFPIGAAAVLTPAIILVLVLSRRRFSLAV
jgi:hypothetical protein